MIKCSRGCHSAAMVWLLYKVQPCHGCRGCHIKCSHGCYIKHCHGCHGYHIMCSHTIAISILSAATVAISSAVMVVMVTEHEFHAKYTSWEAIAQMCGIVCTRSELPLNLDASALWYKFPPIVSVPTHRGSSQQDTWVDGSDRASSRSGCMCVCLHSAI